MQAAQAENTTTSTKSELERKPAGSCKCCAATTWSLKIPAIAGAEPFWIPAPDLCEPCMEKVEEDRLKLAKEGEIHKSIKASMISKRFRTRTFKNFGVDEKNQKAFETAKNFSISDDGKGLMLYGPAGVGKTHLAAAIANKYLGKISVLYVSVPDFLEKLRRTKDDPKNTRLLQLAKSVQLLVLDDIGKEKDSAWVFERLYMVVNYRYEEMLPIIFTTNQSLEELENRLDESVSSRIVEMCQCIQMEGPNRRLFNTGGKVCKLNL